MRQFFKLSLVIITLSFGVSGAGAACGIESGRVSIIGNEFPAIQTVAREAISCSSDSVEVKANLTADHKEIHIAGMSTNPSEYTTSIIATSSIVNLINNSLIRPLDDLIDLYGEGINKQQLITVDGKVMAVAFMANSQHLVYREDIIEEAGLEIPKTYEQVLSAARVIKEKGLLKYPLGGAYKAGWNLAQEFTNMYIGYGGKFFKEDTAEVAINNDKAIAALKMMKDLSEYMNPDFLTHDSNATSAEWKAGNVALMNMWGSRVGRLKETQGSSSVVKENTKIAAPLTVGGGTIPATTLWWDGWTIAKNISDEDAKATFLAMKHAIRPEILNDTTTPQAVWLINGYEPTEDAKGVSATINMNAVQYPMLPFHGLLHTALGAELSDYMQGKEDAAKTLADVELAYTTAAKEKGFLE